MLIRHVPLVMQHTWHNCPYQVQPHLVQVKGYSSLGRDSLTLRRCDAAICWQKDGRRKQQLEPG